MEQAQIPPESINKKCLPLQEEILYDDTRYMRLYGAARDRFRYPRLHKERRFNAV